MGYRLHFAKTYKVEYSFGFFNHHSEEFNRFLYHLCACDWAYSNEDEIEFASEFEIDKEVLKDAIERLKDFDDDTLPEELVKNGHTVAEIEAILIRCLEDSEPEDSLVHFSWF